jgi:hypothetical protein
MHDINSSLTVLIGHWHNLSSFYKNVFDVILSVYPHRAGWKVSLTTVGIEPATFVQAYFSSLPGVDIYTQSNITSIIFTWVHYTNTEQSWCIVSMKNWTLTMISYYRLPIWIKKPCLTHWVAALSTWWVKSSGIRQSKIVWC